MVVGSLASSSAFLHCSLLHFVDSVGLVHVDSLGALVACNPQDRFILFAWGGWFEIHSYILSALTPAELRACICLLADRADLFLASTAVRIQYCGSGFSVATPPVQPALVLAVGQGGGGWDSSVHTSAVSASSASSGSDHNALESSDPNGIQAQQ